MTKKPPRKLPVRAPEATAPAKPSRARISTSAEKDATATPLRVADDVPDTPKSATVVKSEAGANPAKVNARPRGEKVSADKSSSPKSPATAGNKVGKGATASTDDAGVAAGGAAVGKTRGRAAKPRARTAAAKARTTMSAAMRQAKYAVGQVVKHRIYPFRGVIFDIDPVFNNTEEWWQSIPEEIRPVKDQPYYHLLAENAETEYIAYVSEQNLLPDDNTEPLRHPKISELFTEDENGRFQPIFLQSH